MITGNALPGAMDQRRESELGAFVETDHCYHLTLERNPAFLKKKPHKLLFFCPEETQDSVHCPDEDDNFVFVDTETTEYLGLVGAGNPISKKVARLSKLEIFLNAELSNFCPPSSDAAQSPGDFPHPHQLQIYEIIFEAIVSCRIIKLLNEKDNHHILFTVFLRTTSKLMDLFHRSGVEESFHEVHRYLWNYLPEGLLICYIELLHVIQNQEPALVEKLLLDPTLTRYPESRIKALLGVMKETFEVPLVEPPKTRLTKRSGAPLIFNVPPMVFESGLDSARMTQWSKYLTSLGKVVSVCRFMNGDTKEWTSKQLLEDITSSIRTKIKEFRKEYPTQQIAIIGWSSFSLLIWKLLVYLQDEHMCAIFIGFPNKDMDMVTESIPRTAPLIRNPVMFVVGKLSTFTSLVKLEELRGRMLVDNHLVVVNHSDELIRMSLLDQERLKLSSSLVDLEVLKEVHRFLDSVFDSCGLPVQCSPKEPRPSQSISISRPGRQRPSCLGQVKKGKDGMHPKRRLTSSAQPKASCHKRSRLRDVVGTSSSGTEGTPETPPVDVMGESLPTGLHTTEGSQPSTLLDSTNKESLAPLPKQQQQRQPLSTTHGPEKLLSTRISFGTLSGGSVDVGSSNGSLQSGSPWPGPELGGGTNVTNPLSSLLSPASARSTPAAHVGAATLHASGTPSTAVPSKITLNDVQVQVFPWSQLSKGLQSQLISRPGVSPLSAGSGSLFQNCAVLSRDPGTSSLGVIRGSLSSLGSPSEGAVANTPVATEQTLPPIQQQLDSIIITTASGHAPSLGHSPGITSLPTTGTHTTNMGNLLAAATSTVPLPATLTVANLSNVSSSQNVLILGGLPSSSAVSVGGSSVSSMSVPPDLLSALEVLSRRGSNGLIPLLSLAVQTGDRVAPKTTPSLYPARLGVPIPSLGNVASRLVTVPSTAHGTESQTVDMLMSSSSVRTSNGGALSSIAGVRTLGPRTSTITAQLPAITMTTITTTAGALTLVSSSSEVETTLPKSQGPVASLVNIHPATHMVESLTNGTTQKQVCPSQMPPK